MCNVVHTHGNEHSYEQHMVVHALFLEDVFSREVDTYWPKIVLACAIATLFYMELLLIVFMSTQYNVRV